MAQDHLKHFIKLGEYDVSEAARQLDTQPQLWNRYSERTRGATFKQTDDIWVRYRARHELVSREKFAEPHFAEFYPAWDALPALHPIVFDLIRTVRAVYLGGILITRIPPGGVILPHHDRGTWHAEYMDTKVYVPLKANDKCINECGGESRVIRAGEAVIFDNLITHSVENNGDTERVTLIVCMRTK